MEPTLQNLIDRLKHLSEQFQELRDGIGLAIDGATRDPEMALIRSRKVLEYIVRAVFLHGAKQAHGVAKGEAPTTAAPSPEGAAVTFESLGRDVSGLPSSRDHTREKGSVALHTEELYKRFA